MKKELTISILVIICFLTMYSCNEEIMIEKKEMDEYVRMNRDKTAKVRRVITDYYQDLVENERMIALALIHYRSWIIDPLIYFSSNNRRLYTQLYTRDTESENPKLDYSFETVGAYIKGEWYFLKGTTTVYPRAEYKSDPTPFTFEELSYLANRRLFANVVRKEEGEYVASKEFFANALGKLDSSHPNGDSLFLAAVDTKSIDSVPKDKLEEIKRLQTIKQLGASQPLKYEPPSLWQRWFGKKKLFDSKAWKNREQLEIWSGE